MRIIYINFFLNNLTFFFLFFRQSDDVLQQIYDEKVPLKPNQCHFCLKIFKHATSLELHKKIHIFEKKLIDFKCEKCNRCFDNKGLLASHTKCVHELQGRREDGMYLTKEEKNDLKTCQICKKVRKILIIKYFLLKIKDLFL